jgi:REP element-mobilizing transposase RayT
MASAHIRRSLRVAGHDYTSGAYFVTLCTHGRRCIFGEVIDDEVVLSAQGRTADQFWSAIPSHFPYVVLDSWVVMPSHLHGILSLTENRRGVQLNAPTELRPERMSQISPHCGSLGVIVRTFKAAVTTKARSAGWSNPIWQRGYYEHVIRSEVQLDRARRYVITNPVRWALDEENPLRRR